MTKTQSKSALIAKVNEGEQAIVFVILAKNQDGAEILDTQLELALNMAKNVIQMTGAEVNAAGSVFALDPATTSGKITATLESATGEKNTK